MIFKSSKIKYGYDDYLNTNLLYHLVPNIHTVFLLSTPLANSDKSSLNIMELMFLPTWCKTNQSPIWHFFIIFSKSPRGVRRDLALNKRKRKLGIDTTAIRYTKLRPLIIATNMNQNQRKT